MNYILYTFLALLTATSSVSSGPSVKWNPNLSSPENKLNKAFKPAAIDMEYIEDSVERRLSPRTAEVTDKERTRLNLDSSPIVVFINEPEVFEDYRKTKERNRGTSSETDSSVSYKDVLQFLIQVDARLQEQEGRPINLDSHENIKLINFFQDFRRRNEGEDIEDDSESEEEIKKVKEESRSSIERPPEIRKKPVLVLSEERYSKPRVKVSRYTPKNDVPVKRFNFLRTSKPYIGKRGIYEDK
ncbi:uncharacterized protein LOC134677448 [Cydia fagiglandana]|uniref:uncharacterized protein LOC134677448 n=1 Tax=Cydia fagiglandana TaxID=1458189 RepID=UPI002FEE242F